MPDHLYYSITHHELQYAHILHVYIWHDVDDSRIDLHHILLRALVTGWFQTSLYCIGRNHGIYWSTCRTLLQVLLQRCHGFIIDLIQYGFGRNHSDYFLS